MNRTLRVFALAAVMFSTGAMSLALRSSNWAPAKPDNAAADTLATKENPAAERAEEKKETPAQEKAEARKAAHKSKTMMMTPKVDINSASKEDLMKLPGVTDAIADKMIAGRPFASRAELLSKKILTPAEYAKIRAKVVVKAAKK